MSFGEALVVPTSTLAVPINCDITLFKELQTESLRRETYVFFLDLVTEDNYTKIQQGIDTSWDGVYGLFKGSWTDFNEKRRNFRKEIRLETKEKYSRDYAVTSLKSNGLEAYKACLLATQPNNELTIYRDDNISVNKLVTFVVHLKSNVNLAGNVLVDVYGGGKVVSKPDTNVHISFSDDVAHLAIDNLISGKQFTIERKSESAEFRVTAQIAGLVAFPLTVGPILQTRIEDVEVPVSTRGSFVYAARRLEDGHNDTVYVIDGHNHGPFNGQFQGNACICASGERTDSSSLPFNMAGLCIPPQNSKDVRLDQVKFYPESMFNNYPCGGQNQEHLVTVGLNEPHLGVCYIVQPSLNAPDERGKSKECTVSWTLTGTLHERRLVFVK